jgi:hypothetical protein
MAGAQALSGAAGDHGRVTTTSPGVAEMLSTTALWS